MRILISTQKLSATSLCPSNLVSRNFWYKNVAERDLKSTLSLTIKLSRSSRMRPFKDLIIVRQPKQNRALCLYNAFDFYSDIAHKTLLNFKVFLLLAQLNLFVYFVNETET